MITAIIETRDDEVPLAHALAALVPAATEGVLREVIVIDHGSRDGTLTVADIAGCTVIEAARRAAIRTARRRDRARRLAAAAVAVLAVAAGLAGRGAPLHRPRADRGQGTLAGGDHPRRHHRRRLARLAAHAADAHRRLADDEERLSRR